MAGLITITGLQLLDHLLKRRGIGQKISTGQWSVAATTITSAYYFAAENWGPNHLVQKRAGFWRPSNATGLADDFRQAQALAPSTGAVTVRTYTDTTPGVEDLYELDHRIHPEWVIEAMNSALRDVYDQNSDVLSVLKDAGFQSTGTSDWTQTNATLTKVVTAAGVFPGFLRAGSVDVTSSNGGISQVFDVSEGDEIRVFALIKRQDSGTVSLILEDNTNLVTLDTVSLSEGLNWQILDGRATVPSGCSGFAIRLRGSATNADFSVQGVWAYRTKGRQVPLDSAWDSSFKKTTLSYLSLREQGNSDDTFDPYAVNRTVIPEGDWEFGPSTRGSPQYQQVQFHTGRWFDKPLMIEGRRPHADFEGPFTRVLTEAASWDLDLAEAAVARRLFLDTRLDDDMPDRLDRLRSAEFDFKELSGQFKQEGPSERRTFAFMGMRS